ncbi:prokineticin-2 isoform X1 [Neophocaena asiaeorientalis asiaeorientalis]|uniref:Prokineticin-2 n=1 Tax=Neophocaena asiaeorientalis asiaeorientalis TaxID=1706337 RepID=A0A341BM19_NEOAA|nr:prokineticin-2 isoform X1 [Neophocaena asiaeorientalis asiaeorientalis]
MISFSYGILLFFFCFPLCLLFLFLSFLPSFWLCCGSSWFSHILTKSVDDFVLAGGELGQTQTLNSVAGEGQKACDKDPQCGGGMCCAVSIWVKSIRICTPMGKVGDSCHPLTRKNHFGNGRQERRKRKRRKRKKEVPFFGRRMHHTCPCLPGLACSRTSFNRYTCLARK